VVVVGERTVGVLLALIHRTAIEVKNRVIGVELDGTVEVGECLINLVHELVDNAAVSVDRRLVRGDLDGTIEIGKSSLKTASLAERHCPIGVGNGLVPRIEFAALD
jgi:hypothetical protein